MIHQKFRRAVETHDEAEIAAWLTKDVILNRPVPAGRFRGRAIVAELISAGRRVLRFVCGLWRVRGCRA